MGENVGEINNPNIEDKQNNKGKYMREVNMFQEKRY